MNKLLTSLLILLPAIATAESMTSDATTAETSFTQNESETSESRTTNVKFIVANDAAAAAQPSNTITIQPTGLLLMDAAAYCGNSDEIKAGVAIPDVRIGLKAGYNNWKARVDMGFAYGKVNLKDIYLQYNFNPNVFIKGGYFIHNYGLQTSYSSTMKSSMEESTSNEAFSFLRLLGVMAVYDKGQFFGALSLNAESNAMKLHANEMGKTGWGGLTRLAWRPYHDNGAVAQVGISFALQTAQYNTNPNFNHRSVVFGANFPTRINTVSAANAFVAEAKNSFRFSPELLLNFGRVALESQYFYNRVNRHDDLEAFTGWGAYGLLRGIAIGGDYRYNHTDANLAAPSPKSLELVLQYNYTSLSNLKAGIFGGRVNDISLTANWYINKFMIWRLRAGYTHRFDCATMPDVDLGTFQTRLQFIF